MQLWIFEVQTFFFFLVKVAMPNLCYFYLVQTACWCTVGLGGRERLRDGGDGGVGGGREKCTSVTMWLLPKPCRRIAQTEQRALWSVCASGDSSQRWPPLGRHTPYTPLTVKTTSRKTPSANARFLKVGGGNKKRNRRCECLPYTTTPLTYPQVL